MISEPDYEILRQYKRDRAVQAWSFGVAVPLALIIWALICWHLLNLTGFGEKPKPEQISHVTISSVEVHKPQIPQSVPKQRSLPVPPPKPVVRQPEHDQPRPQAQPTEIARVTPQGTPVPRSAPRRTTAASLAQQLARQEAQFSQEAQQLNQSRAISVATADPNVHDTQNTAFKSDVAGAMQVSGRGNGYLFALRMWIENGLHCYYARYEWIYPTGGEETADFPWPICFSPSNDLLAMHRREIPIEYIYPQPGYQLPAGIELTPFEKMVYDQWTGQGDQ